MEAGSCESRVFYQMITTKEEKVSKILPRSIFNIISEDKHSQIIEKASLVEFKEKEHVNHLLPFDTLYILLEGKLDQIDAETGMLIDSVQVGRSLELDSLLLAKKKWKTEWWGRTSGELLAIPFSVLKETMGNSATFSYLGRIVSNIELHKLKNDLRLLGMKQETIQNVVIEMRQIDHAGDLPEGCLIVVSEGVVNTFWLHEERAFELKSFSISDFFVFLKAPEFKYEFSSDFKCWVIDASSFNQSSGSTEFLSFLNIIEQKKFEIRAAVVSSMSGEEEMSEEPDEEDDLLSVEDFKSQVPIAKGIKVGKPVHFMQYDQMDCGAACMAMISHHYHRKINIPTWRSLIHVTREGASMLSIKLGASKVGFDIIGVMSGYKALSTFRMPLIALMSYHYVVVYKMSETHVTLADPAKGLVEMTKAEFLKDYSQNALLLKPTERLLTFPESQPSYKKYYFLFREVASDFALIGLFSVILFIFGLAPPLFIQFIFDQVLKSGDLKLLNSVGISVVLLTVFMALSGFVRSVLLSRMTTALGVKLSTLFFRHTIRLPFNYFAVRNVGDITTRVAELDKIRNFLSHELIQIFVNLIAVILYAMVFYFYGVKFFFLAVTFSVGIFAVMSPLFTGFVKIKQLLFYAMGKNHGMAYEHFRALKTVQSMAAQVQMRWKWEETYDQILKVRSQFNRYALKLMSTSSIAQQLITITFLYTAVRMFMRGELTLGQVVAVSSLSGALIAPVLALVQATDQVTNVRVSFEKIDEIVTSPVEILSDRVIDRVKSEDIQFKNVWFQYGSDHSPWILKDINLHIKKGEKIALVGPSGSGKSTIAYMMNLLYTPSKGEILIGNVSNRKIDLSLLRSRVSMILQEDAIFSGSVLQNIALGDESPNLDSVIRAAKIAEAHEFIAQLPNGYSTVLGDGTKDLSGGQKQRISIARAIYRSPEILILDEATSSLDAVTEKKVVQNLRSELKDTTCFTIAHRLNTIIDSDRIVVVNHGKIVEQGKHEDLLKNQGIYFDLFRKQVNQ